MNTVMAMDETQLANQAVHDDQLTCEVIAEHFEKTDNKKDFVSGRDVKKALERAGMAIPAPRPFGKLMVAFVSGIECPTAKQKDDWSGKHKGARGYYGLKKKNVDYGINDDF